MPVFPLKVKVVLLVPVQTVAAPLILPETEVGVTFITTPDEVAEEQTPLVTTAL